MISLHFQGKPFSITVIQVYVPTTYAKEADVEQFCEDLQDFLEHQRKDVLFIIGDWNEKVKSQQIPGVTGKLSLGVQNEAGQMLMRVLLREHTGQSKHPLPTTKGMNPHMNITRTSPVL